MVSTLIELLGFAAITAGAYVAGGLVAALFCGGALLVVVGLAFEDANAVLQVRRVLNIARGVLVTVRAARLKRREAPAKAA